MASSDSELINYNVGTLKELSWVVNMEHIYMLTQVHKALTLTEPDQTISKLTNTNEC